MKIRKLVLLVLSVLVLSLTSCSSNNDENTTTNDDTNDDVSEVLRVGMDLKFPPFSYIGDDGKAEGFEPLISEKFAEYLGMEVEIVNIDFKLLIPALEKGDVDILIADMSYREDRAEKVDFSKPYRYSQSLALVNKDFAEKNNVNDDMSAEEFFALKDISLVGLAGTLGELVPLSYGQTVKTITEIGTGILEVSNGTSNVLVASNEVFGFQKNNKETTVVHPIGDVSKSSFVVKKGDTEMLEKANKFIDTMYETGGLYDQIKPEWDKIISDFLNNESFGLDYIVNEPTNG